jgi:GNAT superfamily N-acetyltransferase
MRLWAQEVPVRDVLGLRELHRAEMGCQIVHDSFHGRDGWTRQYLLGAGDLDVGYGSVVLRGPWEGTRTVFEFYVTPALRHLHRGLFGELLGASAATGVLAQTNDRLLSAMLLAHCDEPRREKVVFRDAVTTAFSCQGATFRKAGESDGPGIFPHELEPPGDWVLELEGRVVATGGVAWHYNRPYGDVYMEVDVFFRRRGIGTYVVQELKRVCREQGGVPCARCGTKNEVSLRTLQKAGFAPCAHILEGGLRSPSPPSQGAQGL